MKRAGLATWEGGCPRAGLAAPGEEAGAPWGRRACGVPLAAAQRIPAFGGGVPRGPPGGGGLAAAGPGYRVEFTGRGLAAVRPWAVFPGASCWWESRCSRGDSRAVPWVRGRDYGAAATSAAVETWLPDNALMLPKVAATHSAQRLAVLSPFFSIRRLFRCLAKPLEAPHVFLGAG